jgi:hypothetical protein
MPDGSPRKRGRQALPPDLKKQVVPMRIAPSEMRVYEAAAAKEGLEFQKWARKTLTGRAKEVLHLTD